MALEKREKLKPLSLHCFVLCPTPTGSWSCYYCNSCTTTTSRTTTTPCIRRDCPYLTGLSHQVASLCFLGYLTFFFIQYAGRICLPLPIHSLSSIPEIVLPLSHHGRPRKPPLRCSSSPACFGSACCWSCQNCYRKYIVSPCLISKAPRLLTSIPIGLQMQKRRNGPVVRYQKQSQGCSPSRGQERLPTCVHELSKFPDE